MPCECLCACESVDPNRKFRGNPACRRGIVDSSANWRITTFWGRPCQNRQLCTACATPIVVGPCAARHRRLWGPIPALLDKIPDEFKPLAALGLGAVVLVFIALFHGAGLPWIQILQHRGERRLRVERPHLLAASLLFGWSVLLMLNLHLVEVMIWAFVLNQMGLIVHPYDAIYYCANCYTTLGMGRIDVGEHWRIISAIIGISGLFTFAWTTSALVDVVASNRRLINQLEDEREQEMHMRFALRKQQWAMLKTERQAERAEKEKARLADAGSSLRQRFRIWREERRNLQELRREKLREMEALRRQERLEELEAIAKAATTSPEDKKPQ